MILINNQWEFVNDIYDVLRICEENISDEFAKKVEEIWKEAIEDIKTNNINKRKRGIQ